MGDVEQRRQELESIEAHVEASTLPDDRLNNLLQRIEEGRWLVPSERVVLKQLAAATIFRQHGGRYVARGMAWCSDDGVNLRGELR